MSIEASLLAQQLGNLGRDLDSETHLLSVFEDRAVTLEGQYERLKEEYKDDLAKAFLEADGAVDTRNNKARLACIDSRSKMLDVLEEFNHAKALVRMQNANIGALKVRIDIGRSLLSHEKSLHSLAISGIDLWHSANASEFQGSQG